MTKTIGLTRRALVASTAALGATTLLPRRARAAEFEYKMGHSTPAAHPFHQHLLKVADRIGKESAGRMTLNVFPNSQLGGDNDLLSQVRSGAIEICQPAGLILASILPLTAINGMGFAFESYDKVWPTMDGELGKYVRGQITAKVGLVPMDRIWDLGFRQITNSIKPIKSAADLDGMKLRVPGAPALVSLFKSLGTHPVSMQFGEVYTSLQTGVVQAAENGVNVYESNKHYEVAPVLSITQHEANNNCIWVSDKTWNAFTDDEKKWVQAAADYVSQKEPALAFKLENDSAAKLKKIGVKVVEGVDKSGFQKAAAPIQDELAKELGPHAVKILTLVRNVK